VANKIQAVPGKANRLYTIVHNLGLNAQNPSQQQSGHAIPNSVPIGLAMVLIDGYRFHMIPIL
jgi:hypothetical protein